MKLEIVDTKPGVETNELDRNAHGGTELMKYGLAERLDPELLNQFQIIPSRVREIDETKQQILWLHDLPNDPESQHLKDGVPDGVRGWDKFSKLVFVSHWQLQQYHNYLGVPYSKSVVLKNAIVPIAHQDKPDPEKQLRLIYHTTPHRGLEILFPVFQEIAKMYPNLHLDVFSSFDAYGWPERDKEYEELFKHCEDHPQITYHGFQPNTVVRDALQQSHIFAYPCIWTETSCISLMEAMSAGLMCVHSNLGALPETAANWTYMYQFNEDINEHARVFGTCLIEAIELYLNKDKAALMGQRLGMQKVYADSFYTWDARQIEWKGLLESLVIETDTVAIK
jgi:UDP-glucose:(glucosyl)LPS alpha-1,2-glucosyltransferase